MRLSTWVSSPSETALFEETIDDFRQAHPSVDFKFEPIPGNYGEKLQLMLGTHTAPDVFFLKGYLAKSYMSFNVLEPMDDYMANTPNFDKEDFLPFSLEAFQWEGKQYGLPKDFNPYVLFYNKKLFKEAGLDTVPSNWEELEAFSRKLTKDTDGDGEIDQHGIIIEPVMEMVMPFVFQNGGAFQDEDGKLAIAEPEFIEALEYYHGLYKKGIATIPTDVGVGWNGDAFGREKVAMAISGGWLMPFMKDNYPDVDYGIAYLPKGKERATVAFTTSYSIAKDSKYKEDSWELVNYMVGQEGMGKWTSKGLAMPTRRSVAEKNGFYDHPIYSVYMKSAEFAKPFQVEYSERGFEEVVVALQAIFYKNESPEEAMKKISKRIEKYRLVSR
jgi:multiple sugar transport system substrate-binding protein